VQLSRPSSLTHYSRMRSARLFSAAMLLPILSGAQAGERPLSYHGWALGISLDSAAVLAKAQIGNPLTCVGMDTKTMLCQASTGERNASLYFSPVPRRLEELTILAPLDRRASRDSLKKWFGAQWGSPLPRQKLATRSAPSRSKLKTDIIGTWPREGMVLGIAAIGSYDTTRLVSVSIYSPERNVRLMLERADSGRKR